MKIIRTVLFIVFLVIVILSGLNYEDVIPNEHILLIENVRTGKNNGDIEWKTKLISFHEGEEELLLELPYPSYKLDYEGGLAIITCAQRIILYDLSLNKVIDSKSSEEIIQLLEDGGMLNVPRNYSFSAEIVTKDNDYSIVLEQNNHIYLVDSCWENPVLLGKGRVYWITREAEWISINSEEYMDIWDLSSNKRHTINWLHNRGIRTFDYANNKIVFQDDGSIKIYDCISKQEQTIYQFQGEISRMQFTGEGNIFFIEAIDPIVNSGYKRYGFYYLNVEEKKAIQLFVDREIADLSVLT